MKRQTQPWKAVAILRPTPSERYMDPQDRPDQLTSWWAVPYRSREDFDRRAAEEAPRMANSKDGQKVRLAIWGSNVESRPVRATDEDAECSARR